MREHFFSAWTVMCIGLLLSGVTFAQSANKPDTKQTRRVKGQVLTSTYLPPIRIKFDKAFKHVGSQKFTLFERAQAEQYYFVDADEQQRIKRMCIVQFEGYLPSVNATYDYPATKTVELAGHSYIIEAQVVPSVSAVLQKNPQSVAARAVSFLEGKGYRAGEAVLFQRFVRVVDEFKRNEFILLYIEDLSGIGFTATDFAEGGRAFSQKEKILQELSNRALKSFTVLK